MAEQYRPNRAYWKEVARTENILFTRGRSLSTREGFKKGTTIEDFTERRAQALLGANEQQLLGFSLPTKGTFDFIVDTLKQGEAATR